VKIEVGVTHQIRIDGESAWIKLSIEDECNAKDMDDALEALSTYVNDKVIEICAQTASTVQNYTGGK
jgi:hypothetical protein